MPAETEIIAAAPMAFSTKGACAYLGDVSRTQLYLIAKKFGYERNPLGSYNKEDLDGMRLGKPAKKKLGRKK